MKELGVNLAGQRSKSIESIDPSTVALVITLCAEEVCPVVLGNLERLHWPLPDPDRKDQVLTEEQRLQLFREARDELRGRLLALHAERKP
tara:strand:- start:507 stop:776 length:270 start_codon:yes stop_codon:yes gene_type:complete